ncbi:GNAT family N-acetyltransferase [Adhaeribacter aquaticus]|uniref:GNAT family N-acetyltransferase n=1 Tax=Adhaeribacter aquaticus TaxID=299567 RepID=UPI00047E846A|nr:GNAT family N-acetyltransferase [Adhaeribacter aquaticus]
MNDVEFLPSDKGSFVIQENNERLAEMVVSQVGEDLIVYHTGVLERLQGQGLGQQLIEAMVNYAREHQLSVTTYCPFVKARFQADEAQYTDIWKKGQPQLKFL